jgi:hypothetical protein
MLLKKLIKKTSSAMVLFLFVFIGLQDLFSVPINWPEGSPVDDLLATGLETELNCPSGYTAVSEITGLAGGGLVAFPEMQP